MYWLRAIPSHEDPLEALAGACDVGHAWVSAALASGCGLTREDEAVIAAATGTALDPQELTVDILGLRSRLDRFMAASVFVHEETHFYQLISTPYGRLASEMERYFVADIVNLISACGNAGPLDADALPLRNWIGRIVRSSSPHAVAGALLAMAYLHAYALKACFDGTSLPSLDPDPKRVATIGDALDAWPQWLCAQDRAEGGDDEDDDRIQQTSHPSILLTDLDETADVAPTAWGLRVTPREIFEGGALLLQLEWIRDTIGDERDLAQILRVVNPGVLDPRYLVTRRMVSRAFPGLRWPARRAILLILSDLAFWGPSHRDYMGGEDLPVRWEDLHPGFRFARALEVLADHRLRPNGVTPEDYDVMIDAVCSALRWPHPLAMAEASLKHATDGGIPLLAEDLLDPVRRRATQARLEEPLLFVDATNEHVMHEKHDLVVPFVIERGHVRMRESSEGYRMLFMAALSTVARDAFDQRSLRRLFEEPTSASAPIHQQALDMLFGRQAGLFEIPPNPRGADDQVMLGWELAATADSLNDVMNGLREHGLDLMVSALRRALVIKRQQASDWYARDPAIVSALASRRKFRDDGSFTIDWAGLFAIIHRHTGDDVEDLEMLFEDVGMHYFAPELHAALAGRQNRSRDSREPESRGAAPPEQPDAAMSPEQRLQTANMLVFRGAALVQEGRSEEALRACDEVLERFSEAPEPELRELVAMALFNKAAALSDLGRSDDQIEAYNGVAARLSDATDLVLRRRVAKALYSKGRVLGQLGRAREAVETLRDVVKRFGDTSDPVLRSQVAESLFYQGGALCDSERFEDAIAVYQDLDARFGTAAEGELREHAAAGLFNAGVVLRALGRRDEAVAVLGDVAARYVDAPQTALRRLAAESLLYKGVCLGEMGRSREESTVYDEIVARFGNDNDPEVRQQAIVAHRARTDPRNNGGTHMRQLRMSPASVRRGKRQLRSRQPTSRSSGPAATLSGHDSERMRPGPSFTDFAVGVLLQSRRGGTLEATRRRRLAVRRR